MSNPFEDKVLINTFAEWQQITQVSIASGGSFESVYPDMVRAQEKYIIPVIGQNLFDDLLADYQNDGTVSGALKQELFLKVQAALAYFTQLLTRARDAVSVDQNGIRIVSSDDIKQAFQWQVDDLVKYWLDAAYDGIELLLKFMYENRLDGTLAGWYGGTAYNFHYGTLVRDVPEFKKYREIDSMRTFYALMPTMKDVQGNWIKNNITQLEIDGLQTAYIDGTMYGQQVVLLPFLQKALINKAIAASLDNVAYVIDENGISIRHRSGEHATKTSPLSADQMDFLRRRAEKKAEEAMKDARAYMDSVATEFIFPAYFESDLYTDPTADAEELGFDNADDESYIFVL